MSNFTGLELDNNQFWPRHLLKILQRNILLHRKLILSLLWLCIFRLLLAANESNCTVYISNFFVCLKGNFLHFFSSLDIRTELNSIGGTFMSANSELPDISTQCCTKVCPKGHKIEFFGEKTTPGNSGVVFLAKTRR